MFQIIALRAYQKLTGGGDHGSELTPHYDFLLKNTDTNEFYTWFVYQEYGDCYSGWTSATWGRNYIKKIDGKFGSRTHIPNSDIYVHLEFSKEKVSYFSISDNIVQIDEDGGDQYYPNGSVFVNMDYFNPTNRDRSEKSVVYIVRGKSNVGKSFFFQKFVSDLIVTDLDNQKNVHLTDEDFKESNCFITSGNLENLTLDYDKTFYDVIYIDFSRS